LQPKEQQSALRRPGIISLAGGRIPQCLPRPPCTILCSGPGANAEAPGQDSRMRAGSAVALRGQSVNVAYVSAFFALAGSAIGGAASITTSWLTQHSQDRSQRHAQSVGRRERLYGDFIDEASLLFVDALTHEQVDPSKFVQIYATIAKLRLFTSRDIVSKAEKAMQDVVEVYYLPNRDFAKREAQPDVALNILQAFSEACRIDLRD
jgi:hypothetical protein